MKSAITAIILLFSISGFSQLEFQNSIELNVDLGISNDLSDGDFYTSSMFPDIILVESKSPKRVRNYTLGYSRFLNPKHGIKVSLGLTNFGFHLKGRSQMLNTIFDYTYTITMTEFGFSYIRKIPLAAFGTILIEPGIRYLVDGDTDANGLSIWWRNSYAFSLYSGYEIPMMGSRYFATIGLQLKLPIGPYNNHNLSDSQPRFYPYFIGLKIGFNFQFNPFSTVD